MGYPYLDCFNQMPNTNQMTQMGWYIDTAHLQPWSLREGGIIWREMQDQLAGINLFDTNYFQGSVCQAAFTATHSLFMSSNMPAILFGPPIVARWRLNDLGYSWVPDSCGTNNLANNAHLASVGGAANFTGGPILLADQSPTSSPSRSQLARGFAPPTPAMSASSLLAATAGAWRESAST